MTAMDAFALGETSTVVGTGLIAMDVLISGPKDSSPSPFQYAGGTCGNVMAILAWLGWRAVPVGRLSSDDAGRTVYSDFRRFGVTTKFMRLRPRSATPIVIERLRTSSNGLRKHSFSLTCPTCGSWLPRYSPVTTRAVQKIIAKNIRPSVFFFDRASPGAILLAEAYAKCGSLIFFEPSGIADEKLQAKALRLAHICKYSTEQFGSLYPSRVTWPIIEIQTKGSEGLSYRSKLDDSKGKWRNVDAVPVTHLKDSAGAGDWLSAGLIFQLGQNGASGLQSTSQTRLEHALSFGRALAAWNCQFDGARGGMYTVAAARFRDDIRRLMGGKVSGLASPPDIPSRRLKSFRCPRSKCQHTAVD